MTEDTPEVPAPTVPTDRLGDGWERVEASVERLFDAGGADVLGHTLVYEDTALRAAVRRATDGAVDQSWRFFFATRLRFRPPLAPGIGPAMVLPTVKTEAVRSFVSDLRERGVEDVDRGRRERVRTASGDRVRMRQVSGRVALPETSAATGDAVPIEGWAGAWVDGAIFVAGGAYPRTRLDTVFAGSGVADDGSVADDESENGDETEAGESAPLSQSREQYRSAFFDVVRSVGE